MFGVNSMKLTMKDLEIGRYYTNRWGDKRIVLDFNDKSVYFIEKKEGQEWSCFPVFQGVSPKAFLEKFSPVSINKVLPAEAATLVRKMLAFYLDKQQHTAKEASENITNVIRTY